MVRQMGISSSSSSSATPDYSASGPHSDAARNEKENERGENGDEERHERKDQPKTSEKWGDDVVGRWNDGVNGEDGIQGKGSAGCDIVELGAGSVLSDLLGCSSTVQLIVAHRFDFQIVTKDLPLPPRLDGYHYLSVDTTYHLPRSRSFVT